MDKYFEFLLSRVCGEEIEAKIVDESKYKSANILLDKAHELLENTISNTKERFEIENAFSNAYCEMIEAYRSFIYLQGLKDGFEFQKIIGIEGRSVIDCGKNQ